MRKELITDPSIDLDWDIKDIINDFKIKVQSYVDNIEILTNLYYVMKVYFSDAVIEEILDTSLPKEIKTALIRDKKINELGI